MDFGVVGVGVGCGTGTRAGELGFWYCPEKGGLVTVACMNKEEGEGESTARIVLLS